MVIDDNADKNDLFVYIGGLYYIPNDMYLFCVWLITDNTNGGLFIIIMWK